MSTANEGAAPGVQLWLCGGSCAAVGAPRNSESRSAPTSVARSTEACLGQPVRCRFRSIIFLIHPFGIYLIGPGMQAKPTVARRTLHVNPSIGEELWTDRFPAVPGAARSTATVEKLTSHYRKKSPRRKCFFARLKRFCIGTEYQIRILGGWGAFPEPGRWRMWTISSAEIESSACFQRRAGPPDSHDSAPALRARLTGIPWRFVAELASVPRGVGSSILRDRTVRPKP